MSPETFTISIHMVSSLDGYIAKTDNSMGWFETADHYEQGVGGQDVAAFLKTIDCYVMGARTYELALELSKAYGWVYGDTPAIVLSHQPLPVERPTVEIFNGSLHQLVEERLKPRYKNVWVVGGANIVKAFVQSDLADEIRQSILPIILGGGTPFYDQIGQEKPLHLKNVTAYKNGIVELVYEIKKPNSTQVAVG